MFFAGPYSSTLVVSFATIVAAFAFWFYHRDLVLRNSHGVLSWLLPALRALAIWFVIVLLLEPSLAMRKVEGKPSQLLIAIDNSQSMTRKDINGESRFDTAIRLLFDEKKSHLPELADQFNVRVVQTNGLDETTIWSADASMVDKPKLPAVESIIAKNVDSNGTNKVVQAFAPKSALGNIIAENPNAAVLLFSDGVTTDGTTIASAAEDRKAEQPPLFFVGLGAESNVDDAKIVSITNPEQLDQLDSLAGEVRFEVDPTQPARLTIRHKEKIVWSTDLNEEQRKAQSAMFSFPVQAMLQADLQNNGDSIATVNRSTLLEFIATIDQGENDLEKRNNEISFQSWVSLLRNKVLIVDSRPRWETRYIRNALDRDPVWQVEAISTFEEDDRERFLSITQKPEQLAEFDLLILGELDPETIPEVASERSKTT